MKLSKRQIALAVVLAVGLAVLVTDRLSSPEPASGPAKARGASDHEGPASVLPASSTAPETPAPPCSDKRPTIAERIAAAAAARNPDTATIPDALCPPKKWLAELVPPPIAAAPAPAPPSPAPKRLGAAFLAGHALQGVMISGSQRLAVVNGQTLALGAGVDGFTLIQVDAGSAVFCRQDETVILPLKSVP